MCNILVTGSKGQLGSELRNLEVCHPEYRFFFTNSKALDVTDHSLVRNFIIENKIEVIINCAAYTAVDKAESEYELTDAVNHLAVRNFAKIAKESRIQLIHISTDYIFDGENSRPYLESDVPNPKSVYGETKLSGEIAMLKINPENSIIIRTSWVYSVYGNNFIKTMLRLGNERTNLNVITDQVGTPTNAKDLAKTILVILPKINNKNIEIFHYSNQGVCSWYDLAKAIFDIAENQIKVSSIDTSAYPTIAKRPFYSVLNKSKIVKEFDVEIPYWRDSLKSFFKEYKLMDEIN